MELIGAMSEREWGTLSGMYTTEEADFMAQLLDNSSVPDDSSFGVHSSFWASHGSTMEMEGVDDGLMYCSDNNTNANIHSFSQESSYSGGSSSILFPSSNQPSYYLTDFHQFLETNNSSMSISYDMVEDRNTNSNVQVITNNLMEESSGCMKKSGWNLPEADLKMEPERPVPESSAGNNTNTSDKNSKKRPRISGDAQKNKRNARSKNNQKVVSTEEDSNMVLHGQSSSSCCSEDDSNASHELNGGVNSDLSRKGATALNSTGKARASRGTATDPQSLYARKRRERINERLRILQNLVPNGTKVDISTMLEEAVQYVKFLQLQIKLLSSDDMWMYAPIAYNGMDIGLDLKINSSR